MPPVPFAELLSSTNLNDARRAHINELIEVKKDLIETDRYPVEPQLIAFCREQIDHFFTYADGLTEKRHSEVGLLNQLFHDLVA